MKQIYRIFLTLLLVFAAVQIGYSTSKYSVASGKWSSTSTWSLTRGGTSGAAVPTSADTVYIVSPYSDTVDASGKLAYVLNVESGAKLSSNSVTQSSPV